MLVTCTITRTYTCEVEPVEYIEYFDCDDDGCPITPSDKVLKKLVEEDRGGIIEELTRENGVSIKHIEVY